ARAGFGGSPCRFCLPLHEGPEVIEGLHETEDRASELTDLVAASNQWGQHGGVEVTGLEAFGRRRQQADWLSHVTRQNASGDQSQQEGEADRQGDEEGAVLVG